MPQELERLVLVVHQNAPDFFHDIASYVAVADVFTYADVLFGPFQVRRVTIQNVAILAA